MEENRTVVVEFEAIAAAVVVVELQRNVVLSKLFTSENICVAVVVVTFISTVVFRVANPFL